MTKFIIAFLISTIPMPGFSTVLPEADVPGLTPSKASNGKWGYIDNRGCYRIAPKFESAFPFKEGLALVSLFKKFGFIDKTGRAIIRPQFEDARNFSENLAAAMIFDSDAGKKWGFIDKTGKFAIMPQYEDVSDFSGWTAQVKLNGKIFTINKSGEIIYDVLQ